MAGCSKQLKPLKKLGFLLESMNKRINLQKIILDFVNDLSEEHLKALLTAEFNEHRDIMMHILFKAEIDHMDIFLSVLAPDINSAKVARLTIDLLNNMVTSDKAEILCLFSSEVQEVVDKIEDNSTNNETLKKITAFQKSLNSIRDKVTPERISLELLRRTRFWRRYDVEDLKLLRQNPNLECWHFAEILLDWKRCHKCYGCMEHLNMDKMEDCIKLRNDCIQDLMSYTKVGSSDYASYLRDELRNSETLLTMALYKLEIFRYPLKEMIFKSIERLIVMTISLFMITIFISLAMTSPQPSDIPSFICALELIMCSLKRFEMPPQLSFISNLETWHRFIYISFLCIFTYIFVIRDPLFSLAFNALRQHCKASVCVAFRERESSLLINSDTVKVTPYFDSMLYIYDSSYQANVRLLNVNGMMEVEIKNALTDEDYDICHMYMIYGYNPLQSKKGFVSIFTNTYREIIKFLKKDFERCSECGVDHSTKSANSIDYKYYLFGARQFKICTISS